MGRLERSTGIDLEDIFLMCVVGEGYCDVGVVLGNCGGTCT